MDDLTRLKSGIDGWNRYRDHYPERPCSLAEADLGQGYFFAGNFRGVNLQGANLRRACLINADFTGADLRGADLREAYLADAILSNANLIGANFTGAQMDRIDRIDRLDWRRPNWGGTPLPAAAGQDRSRDDNRQGLSIGSRDLSRPLLQQLRQQLRQRTMGIAGVAGLALGMALLIPALGINPINRINPAPQPTAGKLSQLSSQGQSPPQASLALAQSFEGASQVWAVATHTDKRGRSLLIGGGDNGQIQIWDRKTGANLRTLNGHDDTVRTLAVSAFGHWLISGGSDGIKVWRLGTGELIYSLPAGSPIWSVAISPDERTLVSSDYDGNITAWDFSTGQSLYTTSIGVPVWSVKIAPDGQSFISGSSDRIVRQWDLATGTLLQEFTGHHDAVRSVAISPDGKTLASGSWDETIKLWDIASGNLQTTLSGHDDRVVTLAISPDGKTLASGSVDSTLKLWDLSSQQLTKTLDSNVNWILAVAFDSLEQTLISSGKDQPVKVWQ